MSCDRWREALSVIADGEAPAVDVRLVDAHVARCTGCSAFRDGLLQLSPERDDDRAPQIDPHRNRRLATALVAADRASRPRWMRVGLAILSCQILVLSIRPLFGSGESGISTHEVRHVGAFSVAYAVGLVLVVLRPARARTLIPVAITLVGALVLSAMVDVLGGRVTPGNEIRHLPELLSLPLLLLIAGYRPARRPQDPSDPDVSVS